MSKIDIDRFICDFINVIDDKFALLHGDIIQHTLKQQGLVYKNGEIVKIEENTSSNHTPIGRFQTCPKCGGLLIYDDPEFDWYKCEQCGKITPAKELREQPPLTEEQKPVTTPGSYDKSLLHSIPKPQTIKFNKERLMEIAKPESIEEKYDIDIEKMVKEYRESLNSAFLPLGYYPSQLNEFTKVYKNGIEDMLKLIKGGGE